jgi:hypothetical protein
MKYYHLHCGVLIRETGTQEPFYSKLEPVRACSRCKEEGKPLLSTSTAEERQPFELEDADITIVCLEWSDTTHQNEQVPEPKFLPADYKTD